MCIPWWHGTKSGLEGGFLIDPSPEVRPILWIGAIALCSERWES